MAPITTRLNDRGLRFSLLMVLSFLLMGIAAEAIIDSTPTENQTPFHEATPGQELSDGASLAPQHASPRGTLNPENPCCLWVLGCCSMDFWFWDFDNLQGPLHGNPAVQFYNSSVYPPRGARFYGTVTTTSDHFNCSGLDEGGGCPEGLRHIL